MRICESSAAIFECQKDNFVFSSYKVIWMFIYTNYTVWFSTGLENLVNKKTPQYMPTCNDHVFDTILHSTKHGKHHLFSRPCPRGQNACFLRCPKQSLGPGAKSEWDSEPWTGWECMIENHIMSQFIYWPKQNSHWCKKSWGISSTLR